MLKKKKIFLGLLLFIVLISCKNEKYQSYDVDFQSVEKSNNSVIKDSLKTLKVAVSGMISPKETFVSYLELLCYLEGKLGYNIDLVQRKTYQEVNELLENNYLDFAFICSGAYVELSNKIPTTIIAVPVCYGKPQYQAYIITQKDNKINKFQELKGQDFAFTDPLSNTGKLYPTKRINEMGYEPNNFFSKIYFTYGHDNSIKLVNDGIIKGASVDALIFEFIKENQPDLTKNIKIIEKSEYFGIPPIVANAKSRISISKLRRILLQMDEDKAGVEILKKLHIDSFIVGFDSSYQSIRNFKNIINK